jgi:hypothetical protein
MAMPCTKYRAKPTGVRHTRRWPRPVGTAGAARRRPGPRAARARLAMACTVMTPYLPAEQPEPHDSEDNGDDQT